MKITKSYTVKIYRSINDLAENFDPLFDSSSKCSVFCLKEWFALLEQNIYQDSVLIFAVASSSGEPLLVLPCYENSNNRKHLHSLANYYSALYQPVMNSQEGLQADLLSALIKKISHYCESITFQPMEYPGVEYSLLIEAFKKNAFVVEPFFCFGNWFERIQSNFFSDYYQQRPSKLKNTIRRKEKKLPNYQIRIESEYEAVKSILPHYQKIYLSSWKVEEEYPQFIENMVLSLAKMNLIRLGIAYIDNEPAAAQLWFVNQGENGDNIASIFKLAYDPQYKSTSIGSILTSALFKYVIETDQVKEIDFLSGDDAYKKDWMSQRRERWGLVAYNKKTVYGFIYGIRSVCVQWLKRQRVWRT